MKATQLIQSSRTAQGALALGVVVAGGGVAWASRMPQQEPPKPSVLTVMSWNVLARPYTKYNALHHRAPTRLEDASQTVMRYSLAGESILIHNCDIVLLQECEAGFFDPAWNTAAERLLQRFSLYSSRHADNPGTAVLVKKDGAAKVSSADGLLTVGGIDETGGPSKIATVLPIRFADKDISVVSVHFMYDGAAGKRMNHAKLIGDSLKSSSMIVAGDFNCEPGPMLQRLEDGTFLGTLQRAQLQNKAPTGLSADFSSQIAIDHLYTSMDLVVAVATAQGEPKSPWGGSVSRPAKVAGASDHVPIVAKITLPEVCAKADVE